MTDPTRRRSMPTGVARGVGGALAGVLAVALFAGSPARARATVDANALVNYGRSRSDGADSSNLDQTYTLRFRQQVYEPLSYSLELGFNDASGSQRSALGSSSSHGQRLLPRGSLELVLDRAALRASYDGSLEATQGSLSSGLDSWLQRASTQLGVRFSDALQLAVSAMRTARRDAAGTLDSDEGVITAGVSFTRGGLVVLQQNSVNLSVDRALLFSRRLYSTGGNARYTRAFGPVGVSARYGLEYTGGEEESTAGAAVDAPRELRPSAGLYEYNELPTDSPGMGSAPALVDADLASSSGIALGPDGRSFQNVGVDLGRVEAVDELQIFVRDASGRPVGVGQVDWTVYTSFDGRVWQLAQSVAEFSAATSLYSLRFTKTDARFVKAVNLGTHLLPAYVTELQVFVHEQVTAGERTSRSFLNQSAGLSLNATPAPWMRVSFDARGSVAQSQYRRDPVARTWDWSQTLGSRLGPFAATTLDLAYSVTRSEAPVSSRQSQLTSAVLSWEPLPAAAVGLRTSYANEEATGFTSTSWSEGLQARLDPYATLRFTASLDATQQHRSEVRGTLQYVSATGTARARLTRAITTSANGSGQWTLTPVEADSALGSPLPTLLVFQRYWTETTWSPSGALSLRARVGYVSTLRSGIFQNYYLGWQPLQGGAITLTTAYDTDIDAVDGRWARRASAGAVWDVNARLRLELTFSQQALERETNGVRQNLSSQTVYTTLNARL
jgi:hypothetical protein